MRGRGVVRRPEAGPFVATTERTLSVLDFPVVVERLAERAATPMGTELALAIRPLAARLAVEREQQQTAEARRLLDAGEPLPFAGVRDTRAAVARAERGGLLEGAELFRIAETASAAWRLARHLAGREEATPALADVAAGLGDHRTLSRAIEEAVLPDGELRDDASPELHALRRQHRVWSGRVRERLESLIRSPALAPFLQEAIVTNRGGRWVIPIKAENRAQVPGVVHDTSSSGATVFIEPMAVVEATNELRRIEGEARGEERRILGRLSRLVEGEAAAFQRTLEAVGHLDLIAARARLAADMDAVRPEGLDGERVDLRGARHPLLTGAVPIDLDLGGETRALVVTGPNTGGKTVSLKTLGLLALMAQAGLAIPALSGSRLPVFERIFCDSGDEQGVQQNLSTFSSHMTHIAAMLGPAGPGTLVLLDELGAGTDPDEGAALAMALLRHFTARGCLVVATTHYSELKAFAHREPGLRNASVEFDAETLQPTYRLQIGLPGKSNAFAIARRLGLPEDLLAEARQHLSGESRDAADLLEELADLRDDLRRERDAALAARREADAAARAWRETRDALERERAEVARRARERIGAWARRARADLDELVARAREAQAESADRFLAEAARFREGLREREAAIAAEGADLAGEAPGAGHEAEDGAASRPLSAEELVPGLPVYLKGLRLAGEALGPPDAEGQVAVRVGVMRVTVPLGDLARLDGGDGPGAAASRGSAAGRGRGRVGVQLASSPGMDVRPELDLHGLRVDEALPLVDKYLDDAYLAGLQEVRLVHGRGTGALRQAVRRYVADHAHVESWRPATAHEGGAGSTVCRLRPD